MAIYHCSVKAVSRSAGRSATASAAYRSGEKIADERTGEIHDYTRKQGVLSSEIVLPDSAGEWAKDRSQLWNAAELAERRKDACVAREVVVALPAELSDKERHRLVTDFARDMAQREGCAIDVCIHAPNTRGDDRNFHAHLLRSTRVVGEQGMEGKLETEKAGRNRKNDLENIRKKWSEMVNERLQVNGHTTRVDHRSLEAQGEQRMPAQHLGPTATAIERRTGEKSEVRNRQITADAERLKKQSASDTEYRQTKKNISHLSGELIAAQEEKMAELQSQRYQPAKRSPAALKEYRETVLTLVREENKLARLGSEINHDAIKLHEQFERAKEKQKYLSEWNGRNHQADGYLRIKLGGYVLEAKRELAELQAQRDALNGMKGMFKGAEKRELDERISAQKNELESRERKATEYGEQLRKSEEKYEAESAAFKRSDDYRFCDPRSTDQYREREIAAAATTEKARAETAQAVSTAQHRLSALGAQLGLSGDECRQIKNECQVEIEQERQQQEDTARRIQQTRTHSRSNDRSQDHDMEL